MKKRKQPTWQAVHRLYGQARAALSKYPNVITVGVGFAERQGKRTREPCFVVGVSSKSSRIKPQLPAELMGVRVDVQKVRMPRLVSSVAGAGDCRARGRDERGQVGLLAKAGADRFALTALHVLMKEAVGTDVPTSSLNGQVVEGNAAPALPFARIGKLVAGGFDALRDVALVKLDAGVDVSDTLAGTTIKLGAPRAFTPAFVAGTPAVQLEIATEHSITGQLKEWPVTGRFATEGGEGTFGELAKFEFRTRVIKPGWSGGAIFLAASKHPLALVSFAEPPSSTGVTHAYGFPLAPHWQAWGLSPL
jgi:hypothetical protein